jgi:hypothetical protein
MPYVLPRATALLLAVLLVSAGLLALVRSAEAADDDAAVVVDAASYLRFRQPLEPIPDSDPTGTGWPAVVRAELRHYTMPFAADTLHVGAAAGQPVARLFLGLEPVTSDGHLGSIAGGTVTLVDNGEDSVNAAAADMVACLATELIVEDYAADWANQPSFDCQTTSAVVLREGSDPLTWDVDLTPFAEAFADTLTPGIAILERGALQDPHPDIVLPPDPRETWLVSFDGARRTPEDLQAGSSGLAEEVERLAMLLSDPATVTRLLDDPDPTAIAAFVVLQLPPDAENIYRDLRSARPGDTQRSVRPITARLEVQAPEFADFDPDIADGGFDQVGPASSGPASSGPASPGPASIAPGSSDPTAAPAPGGALGTAVPPLQHDNDRPVAVPAPEVVPDVPAGGDVMAAPPPPTATPAMTAGAVGRSPLVLLLPLLGLGVAGLVGYSLTREPELVAVRQGRVHRRLG